MYSDKSCPLCPDRILKLHRSIGISYNNPIVFQDENVFVIPDISPICCGHFLIITRDHINSFGSASDKTFVSLKSAVEFIKNSVYRTNTIMLFEHGAVFPHTAGASVDHAHMHIIPLSANLEMIIDRYIYRSCTILSHKIRADQFILQQFAENNQPYLFYATINDAWAYPVEKLPNQFLRRALVDYMHIETNYNWKLAYNTEESKALYTQTLNMVNDLSLR
jgi:diadenosine tetraphosphate (Ap4A) HIT family hydrolase